MNIAGTIIESMRDMAAQATGLGRELSPSGIVDVGFDVLKRVMNADMGLAETIVAFAVAIIILLIFAAVGVNMVVALAESWFLLYGGLFVLGFGGSRWTTDIAIGYYRQVSASDSSCSAWRRSLALVLPLLILTSLGLLQMFA